MPAAHRPHNGTSPYYWLQNARHYGLLLFYRYTTIWKMKSIRFGRQGYAKFLGVAAATFVLKGAVADIFDGSSYARNVSLSASVDIFWTIDTELETLRVAVHAKTASGWAGFGVSEMGGMEGADIVFYEAAVSIQIC